MAPIVVFSSPIYVLLALQIYIEIYVCIKSTGKKNSEDIVAEKNTGFLASLEADHRKPWVT